MNRSLCILSIEGPTTQPCENGVEASTGPDRKDGAVGYPDNWIAGNAACTESLDNFDSYQDSVDNISVELVESKMALNPINEPGRATYHGESSNLPLVQDLLGTADVLHYPPFSSTSGSRTDAIGLDDTDVGILQRRGAFLLPPKSLCDELVDAYFKWVAPVVPVINRSQFMRQYCDCKEPPSMLLLQAMLLAGSRVCTNVQLLDSKNTTMTVARTFYQRAKALYDCNFEDDRVVIVQALVLLGWYWEGPEGKSSGDPQIWLQTFPNVVDVSQNAFFWTRLAITVAQDAGMHRRCVKSLPPYSFVPRLTFNRVRMRQLSESDKRLWKRIWWTLFTRDRSLSVALGRPSGINTADSDIDMLTHEDFVEDDGGFTSEYSQNGVHAQFFLQYIKLCEIMGLVLSARYSIASRSQHTEATTHLTFSDMKLADWLESCPWEVRWQRSRHNFWAALLHTYYLFVAALNGS